MEHLSLGGRRRCLSVVKAPISDCAAAKFMTKINEAGSNATLMLGLHCTSCTNLESIYLHGLLVGGEEPDSEGEPFIPIAHGKTHGVGIYRANLDAAWLAADFAKGFPEEKGKLIVCAILFKEPHVRVVEDALICARASLVAPILEVTGNLTVIATDSRSPSQSRCPCSDRWAV